MIQFIAKQSGREKKRKRANMAKINNRRLEVDDHLSIVSFFQAFPIGIGIFPNKKSKKDKNSEVTLGTVTWRSLRPDW